MPLLEVQFVSATFFAAPTNAPHLFLAAKKKKKKKPKKKKKSNTQSDPPRVLIDNLFPTGIFPSGPEFDYRDENLFRTTDEEKRALDRSAENQEFLNTYRKAAEVHRQVRQWSQKWIKPGRTLTEIAEGIEDSVRALVGHDGLTEGDGIIAGPGFPTGLSINHCAAHYTPNAGNKMVLQTGDVMKVDFGVQIDGRIVDSAYTWTDQPERYENLLTAVREATYTGVREAGIDVRVGDIGAAIQETMESYEIELDGVTHPIKCIRNLNGHDIVRHRIHGGKSVPIVKSADQTKMEEGEVFAIETFGSTGKGYVRDDLEVSHYARTELTSAPLRLQSAKNLLKVIDKNFGTLPFCRRYLDRLGQDKYLLGLNNLVQAGLVESYPPLVDIKGSYTAQYEHVSLRIFDVLMGIKLTSGVDYYLETNVQGGREQGRRLLGFRMVWNVDVLYFLLSLLFLFFMCDVVMLPTSFL